MSKLYFILLVVFAGSAALMANGPKSAAAATPHPAGTLIRSGQTIWQINEAGTGRLAFDSPERFLSNRLSFDRVVPANSADLTLPESGLQTWGEGVLFADKGVIYQVSNGQKYGFTSAEVFLGLGFNFAMAKNGTLHALPEGPAISTASRKHLDGTLLRSATGTIWMWDNSTAKAFPSAAVFHSYGGNFAEVVDANASDNHSTQELISYKTGALINDNGSVWVVKQQTKLGFPTAQCFLGFGFNFSFVFTGVTSQLANGGTVCAEPNPPGQGTVQSYSSSGVTTNSGSFSVKMASFNLASGKVRVITDTAADQDCTTSCPVASLSTYVSANGARHGMNGTYFCPADYPECNSKSNSFFWKVIDTKVGKMINANNGLGENDPFFTFDSLGQFKYFSKWTDYQNSGFTAAAGINSTRVIENGQILLDVSKLDDKQKNTRASRGFIAIKGTALYLLHVLSATVPESAEVLNTLGMDYALLLDGGGSSALIYDRAYKTGPGRNIPNAVLVEVLP